jgi:hypothetical protein
MSYVTTYINVNKKTLSAHSSPCMQSTLASAHGSHSYHPLAVLLCAAVHIRKNSKKSV